MTITTGRPGVLDVLADIAKSDEGTAQLALELITYDALCEEIDRVRPALDREVLQVVRKRAQGALEHIAKRYPTATDAERAELEEMAGELSLIFAKGEEDDPKTPWYDARVPAGEEGAGQFVARGRKADTYRNVSDALRIFAGGEDKATSADMGRHLKAIASGDRYSRARALGQGLQTIGHPATSAVGVAAQMVGDIGPEAQRAFGRGLTRLAYRYRGTERRPDPKISEGSAIIAAQAQEKGGDQARLRAVADFGAGALYPQVPDQHLAELSLQAGKMPPSRGIIFDAKGRAVVEAQGFNGDHYLPFDLKNLKRLRGGQYVRTRTTGGLTDEDIYTGLLTGARQVTVVSNSGVFSVEFDPSLRGGRRYNDKARQMVGRYAKLTSAVGSNKVYAQDLTPRERSELRRAAFDRAKGNEELATRFYDEDEAKERFRRRFQSRTDDELMDEAHVQAVAELRGKPGGGQQLARLEKEKFQALRTEEREKAVRIYRLDGEGYSVAQRALRQEFPYFIRSAGYQPLDRWLDTTGRLQPGDKLPPRPGADIGYTRRNALTPRRLEGKDEPKDEEKKAEGEVKAKDKAGTTAADTAGAHWNTVLQSPDSQLRANLGDALSRSLKVRSEASAGELADPLDDVVDDKAHTLDWDQWSKYVLDTHHGSDGVAKWLLDPSTDPRNIDKAILSVKALKRQFPDVPGYDGYDEALDLLEQAKTARKPFADLAEEPVLASPGSEFLAPQPFAEIYDLGPDMKALAEYARQNPDIATDAQDLLDADQDKRDEIAAKAIREDIKRIGALKRAAKLDEDSEPQGGVTRDEALLFEQDPQGHDTWIDLERRQKAWALARAIQVTADATGSRVPEIGPKEEVAHRAPRPRRIVMHGPGSPVAKALAARSRPGRPRR